MNETKILVHTPWDISWGFVGAVGGPLQRDLKGNKRSFTEEIAEVLEQLPGGQGKWTINGAQSRPPGEGCGIGYFYPATTEGNERGWSSGCGNERWREWRQPGRSMKMWGPGGGRVTGGTGPPSPRAAAPCAPGNPLSLPPHHVSQLERINSTKPHCTEGRLETSLQSVGEAKGGRGLLSQPLSVPCPPSGKAAPRMGFLTCETFSPSWSDLGKWQGLGLPAFKGLPACLPHPCQLQDSW